MADEQEIKDLGARLAVLAEHGARAARREPAAWIRRRGDRRRRTTGMALATAGLALTATVGTAVALSPRGPGSGPPQEPQLAAPASSPASAVGFATALRGGLAFDYDPLRSPAEAVASSDAIVRGIIVDVAEGAVVSGRGAGAVTLIVYVTSVLKGPAVAGDALYAQVYTGANDVSALRGGAGLSAVLLLTDWADDGDVGLPPGMPPNMVVYGCFVDGLWLQGSADPTMVGVFTDAPSWGPAGTLDNYWAALEDAAG